MTTKERRLLFLEMATQAEGVGVNEVYRRAVDLGDTATQEAYYNLARRLVHRGLLVPEESGRGTLFRTGVQPDEQWMEEDELATIVDSDYPILAITIWKESRRQINEVPEEIWIELRERLRNRSARKLFAEAIMSYCDDFSAQIAGLIEADRSPSSEIAQLRQEAENSLQLLRRFTKYGLGLSKEAISLPANVDQSVSLARKDRASRLFDLATLEAELEARVADENFIVAIDSSDSTRSSVVAGVDGSLRGGILSFLGEGGDFGVGHAPMISISTAVGQIHNRSLRVGNRTMPVFTRLPEKPEDMQRQDNKYTMMAKLLYPDLSDAEYVHSVWNAMDLIEAKVALRLMNRWYAKDNVEIPPADVVLRDGTISPQDRDFNHYADPASYGKIVRDAIGTNWEIAQRCRENEQTIAGVIKEAQLGVYAPVINWFACQVASQKNGQLKAWPILSMNLLDDQAILTRLLTAGRKRGDAWSRTCVLVRPFHALTNYGAVYSRTQTPIDSILNQHAHFADRVDDIGQEKTIFWETLFRPDSDPYLKMLRHTAYGNFFLASVPRLDMEKYLPRLEVLVPVTDVEDTDRWSTADAHRDRLINALTQTGFEVSAEHAMFNSPASLDILPTILIRAHDTVKIWAAELLSRVQEFIGYYLARYVRTKRTRGIRVRPFSRQELELLYSQLRSEREAQAGGSSKERK